jgi:hypothetical protein
MLISPEEAELFFALYPSVIGFAAGRSGGIEGIRDAGTFKSAPNESKAQARNHLLNNIQLIKDYMEENPDGFRERELGYMSDWSLFMQGDFFAVQDLKKYTVFLAARDSAKAYGVLGLTDKIADMLPPTLPILIKAVLLPWKGQIIWDGLFTIYNISFGSGIRGSIRESYRQAKVAGIITSLDPNWKPTKPTLTKKPKTPTIHRFLKKKCPKTVEEFKQKYGEPRMDLAGEAAREYSLWSIDGTPSIDADILMIYANIIRHQVLYVYAKEGKITYVSVVDPTDWSRNDFRPHEGQRLLS